MKRINIQPIEQRAKEFFPKRRHGQDTPTCLIIDGMNLAYQSYHAYSRLSYKGVSTSIRFGFLQILKGIIQYYPCHKLVVCWDGKKHPERLKVLPTYKGHREKSRDDTQRKAFIKEIKSLRVLLKYMGISQAYNPDMEGDDMIYWIWKKMQPGYKVVIITADKDMHQLINYDTTVFNPRTKVPFSNFAYICDHLVEPYQFVDYLCLLGDSSDDIPGYYGIGPSRAAGFFRQFKGIQEYLSSPKDFPGMVDKEKVEEVWKRNRFMLDLKLFNEQHHKPEDVTFYKGKQYPQWNQEKYNQYCLKYGLKTMLMESFYRPFKKLTE